MSAGAPARFALPGRARWHRPALASLALLLLLALPVLGLIATSGFNGLYGQDAYAYWEYAAHPLRESVLGGGAPPRFHWPPGYPFLVTLATLVGGTTPRSGQGVSLLAGALVPALTMVLAGALRVGSPAGQWPWGVPLLAGVLVALNGQLWQSSAVVMADTTALALATLGMVGLARYGRRGEARWLLLAAGGLAGAIGTRLAYLLVALPAALYVGRLLYHTPRARALRHGLLAGAVGLLLLGPLLAMTLRDLANPERDFVSFAAAGEVYRWHPRHAWQREHESSDGVLRYALPNALYYALTPARGFYLTPLFALWIPVGLVLLWRQRDALRLTVLAGWPGVLYLFHAGTAWQNVRFTLGYLPPLAILSAMGLLGSYHHLRGRGSRRALGLLLLVGVGWQVTGALGLTSGFIERMQDNVATARWAAAQMPPDAQLFTFGLTLTLQHESALATHDLYFLTPADLAALLASSQPAYLLLDVANIEAQWQGRSPAIGYAWLRDGPGLRLLATRGAYTLFQVED